MLRVDGQHIAAVVVIQLYGYMDTNTLNKGKRNEIIIKKGIGEGFLFRLQQLNHSVCTVVKSTGARGKELQHSFHPFCLYIYFQYNFFIISPLFPYFSLYVSRFIQSYVNSNLHMSTLNIVLLSTYRVDICKLLLT